MTFKTEVSAAIVGQSTATNLGRIVEMSVIQDESWSPYIQATLTTAIQNASSVFQGADPRDGTWIDLTLTKIDDQEGYTGKSFRLMARDVEHDLGTGELRFTLTSDEGLLQDYRWYSQTPHTFSSSTVATRIGTILDEIGASLSVNPGGWPTFPENGTWEPGSSGWEVASTFAEAVGGRLRCDAQRRWHLVPPGTIDGNEDPETRPTIVVDGNDVTEAVRRRTREDEWYSGTVIHYTWGTSGEEWSINPPNPYFADAQRIGFREVNGRPGSTGGAQYWYKNAVSRGDTFELTMPWNFDIAPGAIIEIRTSMTFLGGGASAQQVVQSVEWNSDGSMMIRTREWDEAAPF